MSTPPPIPHIAFRTTAGKGIGFGHLRRCLTLADELLVRGAQPVFWLDGDQAGAQLARASGYEVDPIWGDEPADSLRHGTHLPGGVAAVVVDSYALDDRYFRILRDALRAGVPRGAAPGLLLVIDDLADRFLDADLVLNSNADAASLGYRVAPDCHLLLGAEFALLRPAFRGLARRVASGSVARVLVTLGGADPEGVTAEVVQHLLSLDGALAVTLDVVLGPLYGHAAALDALAAAHPATLRLHRAPPQLASLMRAADLAIAAGGQTTYELAAAGVPTVALRLADNQRGNLTAMAARGTLLDLAGARGAELAVRLGAAVRHLAADGARRQAMIQAGQDLVDGRGAERVAGILLSRLAARTHVPDAGNPEVPHA